MKNDNQERKKRIKAFKDELCKEFNPHTKISTLVRKLSVFIDKHLIELFNTHQLNEKNHFCLLALGSYGRRELLLHSDIDLLLLHSEEVSKAELHQAQCFIQDCWDVGLEVGHQITTVAACAALASKDLSVISNIMDAYHLCGTGSLMEELMYLTRPVHMWSSSDYFLAKKQEQKSRYTKYGETAYHLEPNVKYGPGGLRDLQILLSIAKRHFPIKNLAQGISYGFITEKEFEELMYCAHFLWRVRFALHMLADKAQERLSFEYQVKLAEVFGYKDEPHSLAIEQFMKLYFKVIKRNRELNEMLLQGFDEAIVFSQKHQIIPLDEAFQLANNCIEVRHNSVFLEKPTALLGLFLWMVQRPDIDGIRASTVRLIRESLYLIDEAFKNSPIATELFLSMLRKPNDPYEALKRMNRYGVLAHYLDCFAAVTGQMQYDLFHAYTVDQHTLFVIRNISRFKKKKYQDKFSLCSSIMAHIEHPEIVYLSALFHDIAKGRGGDHSELGASEAQDFARRHHLPCEHAKLLVWLVRHHLLMSHTAQRLDIYDPKTIEQFSALLPQPHYLDYLYLLTVADICATNPNLWNAWKDSLLKELYRATKAYFHQEQELLGEQELIAKRKHSALDTLVHEGFSALSVEHLWSEFETKYFLHESPKVIARHTKAILTCRAFPLVLIMPHHSQGGTEVFIYTPHQDARFTITTSVLSNHHVTIQEAAITTCQNQFDLDTYIILDENNQVLADEQRIGAIERDLVKHLSNKERIPPVTRRRLSPALAHFKVRAQISYTDDLEKKRTHLFLVCNDRPGLLASISRVFLEQNIRLHNAKIATAGERAEDTFYISNQYEQSLSEDEKEALRVKLIEGQSFR
jgi:[protein-PII] uridylyltransferase